MRLHNTKLLDFLKSKRTIPEICGEFDLDEFDAMHRIAQLEQLKLVKLTGFDRIYREDGGAIYLAEYEAVA